MLTCARDSLHVLEFQSTPTDTVASLGLTDREMAEVFDVSGATFNSWKHQHPGFLEKLMSDKKAPAPRRHTRSKSAAAGSQHHCERSMVFVL